MSVVLSGENVLCRRGDAAEARTREGHEMTITEARELETQRDEAWDVGAAHGDRCVACGGWNAGDYARSGGACGTGRRLYSTYQSADDAVRDIPEAVRDRAGV